MSCEVTRDGFTASGVMVVTRVVLNPSSLSHRIQPTCLTAMSFQGAAAYFTESEGVSLEAIEDNHTEEIESLEASFQVDDQQLTDQLCSVTHEDESASGKTVTTSPSSSKIAPPVGYDSDMDYNLKRASEHVIVSSTLSNYERTCI
jgi:hypothetical protein